MRRGAIFAGLVATLAVLVAAGAPAAGAALPPIRHVFVIVLENKGYDETFGAGAAAKAPYLAHDLVAQGALLRQYFGVAHESLPNYVAMISGQAPNPATQSDCQFYTDVVPGTIGADGQAFGAGCVYPAAVRTLPDQLDASGLGWRGYMQDMAADSQNAPTTCRHPAPDSQDGTQSARAGDEYAARHDPFVYFHSIVDDQARCDRDVVDLMRLTDDLGSDATTPALSFITPDLCEDGHDSPCVDGRPGGLVSADAFLRQWVPEILASPAYADGGLLLVTFDEADGFQSDSSACCSEPTGPSTPMPGIAGPGGGRTGAVAISPYIRPGTVSDTPYNHYSLLRSLEDLYGVGHLGYAGADGLKPFGADVFTQPAGVQAVSAARVRSRARHRHGHRAKRRGAPAARRAPRARAPRRRRG
jgi:phosphatidylinositol-3-phosphatase